MMLLSCTDSSPVHLLIPFMGLPIELKLGEGLIRHEACGPPPCDPDLRRDLEPQYMARLLMRLLQTVDLKKAARGGLDHSALAEFAQILNSKPRFHLLIDRSANTIRTMHSMAVAGVLVCGEFCWNLAPGLTFFVPSHAITSPDASATK